MQWVAPSTALLLNLPVTRSCMIWEHCCPHASEDMARHWELRLLFMQPVSTCTTFNQMKYSLSWTLGMHLTAYMEIRC